MKQNKHVIWTAFAIIVLFTSVILAPNAKAATPFKDVGKSQKSYEAILDLHGIGAITGYEDGTFRPNENVTRGQAAKILVLGLGIKIQEEQDPNFKDVQKSHQFYPYIATLKNLGIIDGYEDGTFGINDYLQRGQMAKIIASALELEEKPLSTFAFKDVDSKSYYANYLQALIDLNITNGMTDDTFAPSEYVNRGQMALFIYRGQQAVPNEEPVQQPSVPNNPPGGDVVQPVPEPTPTPSPTPEPEPVQNACSPSETVTKETAAPTPEQTRVVGLVKEAHNSGDWGQLTVENIQALFSGYEVAEDNLPVFILFLKGYAESAELTNQWTYEEVIKHLNRRGPSFIDNGTVEDNRTTYEEPYFYTHILWGSLDGAPAGKAVCDEGVYLQLELTTPVGEYTLDKLVWSDYVEDIQISKDGNTFESLVGDGTGRQHDDWVNSGSSQTPLTTNETDPNIYYGLVEDESGNLLTSEILANELRNITVRVKFRDDLPPDDYWVEIYVVNKGKRTDWVMLSNDIRTEEQKAVDSINGWLHSSRIVPVDIENFHVIGLTNVTPENLNEVLDHLSTKFNDQELFTQEQIVQIVNDFLNQ